MSNHPIFNFLCSTDSDFDETWWECYYANIMNPQKISDDYLNSFMSFGRLKVMGYFAFLRRADEKSHDLPTLISNISRTIYARRLKFSGFIQFD